MRSHLPGNTGSPGRAGSSPGLPRGWFRLGEAKSRVWSGEGEQRLTVWCHPVPPGQSRDSGLMPPCAKGGGGSCRMLARGQDLMGLWLPPWPWHPPWLREQGKPGFGSRGSNAAGTAVSCGALLVLLTVIDFQPLMAFPEVWIQHPGAWGWRRQRGLLAPAQRPSPGRFFLPAQLFPSPSRETVEMVGPGGGAERRDSEAV